MHYHLVSKKFQINRWVDSSKEVEQIVRNEIHINEGVGARDWDWEMAVYKDTTHPSNRIGYVAYNGTIKTNFGKTGKKVTF